MKIEKATNKDRYHIPEQKWIDFSGTVAYVSIIPMFNPALPYERKRLLLPNKYQLTANGKQVKP